MHILYAIDSESEDIYEHIQFAWWDNDWICSIAWPTANGPLSREDYGTWHSMFIRVTKYREPIINQQNKLLYFYDDNGKR